MAPLRHRPALAAAALLAGTSAAIAQGFDCTKARTVAEHVVCGDRALGDLDEELNRVYDSLTEAARTSAFVKARRAVFFDAREACGYDTACIATTYEAFIAFLRRY